MKEAIIFDIGWGFSSTSNLKMKYFGNSGQHNAALPAVIYRKPELKPLLGFCTGRCKKQRQDRNVFVKEGAEFVIETFNSKSSRS